jgi:uncharacterized protein (TIGR03067 family)
VPPGANTQANTPAAKGKDGTWAAWSPGNVLVFGLHLSLKDSQYKALVRTLGDLMIAFHGVAELAESRSRMFDLAAATQAYLKAKGTFPRGTVERRTSAERVLEWRPDQRLSWTVDILPFLGGGEYGDLRFDRQKSWSDDPNRQLAHIPVPYFLPPNRPGEPFHYLVSYPGLPDRFAATQWTGIAGVGMDAAYYNPSDPAVASKVGVFGYDRTTRPSDVKDGLENTIVLIQVPADRSAPWTAGGGSTVRGVSEDSDCLLAFVCTKYNDQPGTFAIMGDGKVRFIPATMPPDTFRALCTIAGKEKIHDLDKIAPVVPSEDQTNVLKTAEVVGGKESAQTKKDDNSGAKSADVGLLQGTWQVVSAESGGKAVPSEAIQGMELIVLGDKLSFKSSKGTETGTFTLDTTKSPKWIDIWEAGKKETQLGVYEVSANELKICLAASSEKKRPTALRTSAGSQDKLVVLQRTKR